MPITITEALAEIKTINKRAEKKRTFISDYLYRQDGIKDPLEKDGGSVSSIARERDSLADLENRVVALRRGIQRANDTTVVTINGISRSIADWLTWRRDVAPKQQQFLASMRQKLNGIRDTARRNGVNMVSAGVQAEKPQDIVVNISEPELAAQIELIEDSLGQLDGQLSLRNATVQITEVA